MKRLDWLKLVTLVCLPFVCVPALSEQRELPRQVLLQIVALASLGAAITGGRLVADKRVLLSALAFCAALLGASFFGADSTAQSLYGPYAGHTGALAWVGLCALLLAPPPTASRHRYLLALTAVAVVQAVIGLFQRGAGSAPTGTLGHPMFLAGFLVLGVLAALHWVITSPQLRLQVLAGAAACLCVAVLGFSARRGPMLALFVAVAVLAALTTARRRVLTAAAALVVVALIATGVLPVPGYRNTPAGRWSGAAVAARHDTVAQRRDFYRVAGRAALERPLLGWGFGSFEKIYAARKVSADYPDEPHVHDVWLAVLLAAGATGGLAFVLLLLALFAALLAATEDRAVTVTAAAAFAGYLVFRTFNFDQPAVAAWAFMLVACALPVAKAPPVPKAGLLAVLVVAFGFLGAQRIAADAFMARCLSGHAIAAPGHIEHCRTAVWISPHECWYHRQTAALIRGHVVAAHCE